MVMSVREIDQLLEQWEMSVRDLHRRVILAPTPRERERWHAVWLLAQGWTASSTAKALERDPHTIGRWVRCLRRRRPGGPDIRADAGGSPRPRRGGAGGTERSGTGVARCGGHWYGQLELEGGS